MDTGAQPWLLASPSDIQATFESAPDASRHARDHLESLTDQLPAIVMVDLRTVVTELVSNCVLHGSGNPIDLAVELMENGSVRGSVADGGWGRLEMGAGDPVTDAGLGLRIVDALASRWGVRAPSSDVWFELAPVA